MNIFLIDDSTHEQDIFKLALHRVSNDADFYFARSCKEAVDLLQHSITPKPDYIILDVDTPAMDADACLCTLKDAVDLGSTPLIVYTDTSETTDIDLMDKYHARFHLYKSRDFRVFCKDLSHILSEAI
jgi:CheY-like chemotaxis protein